MNFRTIKIGGCDVSQVQIGGNNPLVFIGGPCAIESKEHTLFMAEEINNICLELKIPWIFKSCYDKDCRSSKDSFHGIGILKGLQILELVREKFKIPVVSDFSDPSWANDTGKVCDLIQIPAYLCRQTTILKSAAETNKPIHLKKGQFMSPWNMKNSVRKLEKFGSKSILLTDISGGQREFIPFLVRAASACGINALFMEVHNDPPNALSDSNTVLNLKYLKKILSEAKAIHKLRLELIKKNGEFNIHEE